VSAFDGRRVQAQSKANNNEQEGPGMLSVYVWMTSWVAARREASSRDDRGAVSVEHAILIGVVAVAALAVGSALTVLVARKIAEWSQI
jgi:Flp pilus assembly pilin Flp